MDSNLTVVSLSKQEIISHEMICVDSDMVGPWLFSGIFD
jgi:hypothetical protein